MALDGAKINANASKHKAMTYDRMKRKERISVRGFCAYVAVFWGIRVALQGIFNVKKHLTAWWTKAGYFALTPRVRELDNNLPLGCGSIVTAIYRHYNSMLML